MDQLPEELIDHVLSYVSPYTDLPTCRLVCRRWYESCARVRHQLLRLLRRCVGQLTASWFHFDCVQPPSPSAATSCASPIPVITRRCAHSAAMLDRLLYVFGGCSWRMTTFNDLWTLEPSDLHWVRPRAVGSYPSPKAYASMVAWRGQLLVFGGWSQSAPHPLHQTCRLYDELHVYDTSQQRWEQMRGLAGNVGGCWPPPIAGHGATVLNDQMIVAGGLQQHENSRLTATNQLWVLDLSSCEWRQQEVDDAGGRPEPRYGHSQMALDDRHLLVMGGTGGPNKLLRDVWMLETTVAGSGEPWRWHKLDVDDVQDAPAALWCHQACRVGDTVVVLSHRQADGRAAAAAAPQLNEQHHRVPPQPARAVPRERPLQQEQPASGQLVAVRPRAPASAAVGPPPSSSSSGRPSVRPNARFSHERRLQGLDRMQARLELVAADVAAPSLRPRHHAAVSATCCYRLVPAAERRHSTLLHALDVGRAVSERRCRWNVQSAGSSATTPPERMLYSLTYGRGELILFGGVELSQRSTTSVDMESTAEDTASNSISVLSVPPHMFD